MSLGRTFTVGSTALKIPAVGLGTWQSKPGEVKNAVSTALKVGYVGSLDMTAISIVPGYTGMKKSELIYLLQVGQALAETKVPRKDIWLTSKLWNSYHSPELVEPVLDETLESLGVSYLDLYLMHWPVAFGRAPDGSVAKTPKDADGKVILDKKLTEDPLPTWQAMEKLVDSGKVKSIGVSNFNIRRLEALLKGARIKPAFNQVELNFNNPQPELLSWCKENDILLEAYSPLGSTGANQREIPEVKKLAEKYGVDAANILISWQVQRGVICLPKSVTDSRIESNFKDVELSSEDLEMLERAAISSPQKRAVDPASSWGLDIFEDAKQKAKL